jgi:hypothetical protein
MECGSEASAHAEADASALQKWLLPFLAGGRGGLWSAEAKLPPTLKLTLQHSKGSGQGAPPCAPTPLAHAGGEGLGVRAKTGGGVPTPP